MSNDGNPDIAYVAIPLDDGGGGSPVIFVPTGLPVAAGSVAKGRKKRSASERSLNMSASIALYQAAVVLITISLFFLAVNLEHHPDRSEFNPGARRMRLGLGGPCIRRSYYNYQKAMSVRQEWLIEHPQDQIIDVHAPAGWLGVCFNKPDGAAQVVVSSVNDESPVRDQVRAGDVLLLIDDVDVTTMTLDDAADLIVLKSGASVRKLTIARR